MRESRKRIEKVKIWQTMQCIVFENVNQIFPNNLALKHFYLCSKSFVPQISTLLQTLYVVLQNSENQGTQGQRVHSHVP